MSTDFFQSSGIKVNSWVDKKPGLQRASTANTKPTTDRIYSQRSEKVDLESEIRPNKFNSPRNCFSSFLDAQYEEDYSVLALSEDLKKPGNQGFFLEDSKWSQSLSQKENLIQKRDVSKQTMPSSRDLIVRESLGYVVEEEAKQNGHNDLDTQHADKKVSAMFDNLDPSNLESILGKERYERLIKNFEESEELVDGVSSATGTGWLKDSSEGSFNSNKNREENVMDTLSTHRSNPPEQKVSSNIQIEISEPYKDYEQQLKLAPENKQKNAFDLLNLINSGKDDVSNLPVVPDPFSKFESPVRRTSIEKPKVVYTIDEIYREADRISDVGTKNYLMNKENRKEEHINNTTGEKDDQSEDECTRTLRDYDKRLSKSGVFSSKELNDKSLFDGNYVNERLTKSGNRRHGKEGQSIDTVIQNHENKTGSKQESTKTGLLAKASLDTTTETLFRNTFANSKEANGEDITNDFQVVSHLTTEDHVEGIRQHIEIRLVT